jgi:hypothetical protein
MKFRNRCLVPSAFIAAAAALTLAACGDDGGGGAGGDLASVVPADAPVFVEAAVRPEGELKTNIEDLVDNVAGINPGEAIVSQIDSGLSEDGFTYKDDIEPWLGENAAVFVSGFEGSSVETGAIVVETTDSGAAQDFIDRLAESSSDEISDEEFEGVKYKSDGEFAVGIVDDLLVGGDPKGFEAAVTASGGDALADDSQFSDTIGEAPSDSLADVYVDVESFTKAVQADLDPATSQFFDSLNLTDQAKDATALASLIPGSDRIEVDFRTNAGAEGFESADLTEFISSFPASSFAAFATPDVGDQIKQGIEQIDQSGIPGSVPPGQLQKMLQQVGVNLDDLANAVGDVGLFVEGTSMQDLGGAAVVSTDDPEALSKLLDTAAREAGKSGAQGLKKIDGGFEVRSSDLGPKPLIVKVEGDRMAIAYGAASADAALSGESDGLSSNPAFGDATDALGGSDLAGFVDFGSILKLAENLGAGSDPDYALAKPYLEKLGFLVLGSGKEGDFVTSKVILGLTGE